MHNRRHIVKISLASGFLAATGLQTAIAQDEESTAPEGIHTRNKVFTNVLEELPRAEDGELACVAWNGNLAEGNLVALIHNATEDEFIMRQGWCKAFDADGNLVAEQDRVDSFPYSYEADSYGIFIMRFEQNLEGTTELEFEFPTEPMSEASGQLGNVSVQEFTAKTSNVSAKVLNDTDTEFFLAPVAVVFFNEEMEIVGAAANPVTGLGGPESIGNVIMLPIFGEYTDHFLFAAFGSA